MITPLRLVRRSIGLFVGLCALSCAITLLYLGASAVMTLGGSCGAGGPYVVETSCPEGIAWIMPVSVLGGLVSTGLYALSVLPVGPKIVVLAWPALFISLGWAFLDAAVNPEYPVDWGFMVCAVLFILMGGLPLLFLANRDALRRVFWGVAPPEPTPQGFVRRPGEVRWTTTVELPGDRDRRGRRPSAPVPPEPAPGSGSRPGSVSAPGLVDELERLAALHQAGGLDDAEYTAAKNRLLNG
ncbi:SHOCT domain-containing protein [Planotetraspora kaengkrachanensis]|uniref:SHOCT domain-containing protein n=1 Tax=Planotetraspora kaengkrachanensis TaxID=575193 RepID=A0A8J3PWE9_9ACTN|nr:SHOCT domain-containing protein [Planotetraspora kaengkrachanensis]GIG82237.1 hypothetical protein Pka01_53640 [Planotetraspora kaengkrachanensis]